MNMGAKVRNLEKPDTENFNMPDLMRFQPASAFPLIITFIKVSVICPLSSCLRLTGGLKFSIINSYLTRELNLGQGFGFSVIISSSPIYHQMQQLLNKYCFKACLLLYEILFLHLR